MNVDRFDVLERFVPMFEAPEPSFDGFLRRRDRRRRNQRVAAGAVGIAVFVAAIWIVTTGGPFDRTSTPASTGPTVAPHYPGQVGLVGLAPEGTTPSSPSMGELVLWFRFSHTGGDPGRFSGHLYADGRLIWERLGDPSGEGEATGLIEQHLSPGGVQLLKSEVLRTGLFDDGTLHFESAPGLYSGEIEVQDGDRLLGLTWGGRGPYDKPKTMLAPEQASALVRLDARLGDLASWLPASAWEDPGMRTFVPSRYSVCVEAEQEIRLDAVLARFPQEAAGLLRTRDWTHDEVAGFDGPGTTLDFWCSAVTTETARALAQIVARDAEAHSDVFGAVYELGRRVHQTGVRLSFGPMLPHER
jgi:hypothetical protein